MMNSEMARWQYTETAIYKQNIRLDAKASSQSDSPVMIQWVFIKLEPQNNPFLCGHFPLDSVWYYFPSNKCSQQVSQQQQQHQAHRFAINWYSMFSLFWTEPSESINQLEHPPCLFGKYGWQRWMATYRSSYSNWLPVMWRVVVVAVIDMSIDRDNRPTETSKQDFHNDSSWPGMPKTGHWQLASHTLFPIDTVHQRWLLSVYGGGGGSIDNLLAKKFQLCSPRSRSMCLSNDVVGWLNQTGRQLSTSVWLPELLHQRTIGSWRSMCSSGTTETIGTVVVPCLACSCLAAMSVTIWILHLNWNFLLFSQTNRGREGFRFGVLREWSVRIIPK